MMTRDMVLQDVRKNLLEWQPLALGLFLGALTVVGVIVIRAVIHHLGPQATIQRDADIALINGQVAWVHLIIDRKSTVCADAKVIRQAVTYKHDDVSQGIEKTVDFAEDHPSVTEPGHYDFWAEYHLRSPLIGAGWHYISKSYDGCGITGTDFGGSPVIPPPTPIRMVGAPAVPVNTQ